MRGSVRRIADLVAVLGIIVGLAWVGHTVIAPVRVDGGSMEPALAPGDIVLVALGHRPIVGDIALIRAPGHEQVLHRVVELEDWGVVRTKGDANPVADFHIVPAAQVAGRCVAVLPVGTVLSRWRGRPSYATIASQPNSTRR